MLRQAEANGNVSTINNNINNNKGAMEQQERRQRHASDHSQQQERSDTFMEGVQEKRNIKHRTLRNTISLHPIWCKIFIFCRKISLFLLKHSKTQHCSCIIICALEFDFLFFQVCSSTKSFLCRPESLSQASPGPLSRRPPGRNICSIFTLVS